MEKERECEDPIFFSKKAKRGVGREKALASILF